MSAALVKQWFNSLPRKARQGLSAALKAEADGLSAAQKRVLQHLQKPPADEGKLENSLRVEQRDDLTYIVKAGGKATTEKGYDYANAFEFGTERQPAQSFFYSTYRSRRRRMRSNIRKALKKALEQ